jgi:prevent-host-death family protein
MRTIGVAELKASLSETLARVKAGDEVLVTEHGRPVARILSLSFADPSAFAHEELVRMGILRIPERGVVPKAFWDLPRGEDAPGAVRASLQACRREGGE